MKRIDTSSFSLVLFWSLFIALVFSLAFSYYIYIIKEDFVIYAHVSCDPVVESCFVQECYAENDETCTEHNGESIQYFKVIYQEAHSVQDCGSGYYKQCGELSCSSGISGCQEILCSQENKYQYQEFDYCG